METCTKSTCFKLVLIVTSSQLRNLEQLSLYIRRLLERNCKSLLKKLLAMKRLSHLSQLRLVRWDGGTGGGCGGEREGGRVEEKQRRRNCGKNKTQSNRLKTKTNTQQNIEFVFQSLYKSYRSTPTASLTGKTMPNISPTLPGIAY